MNVTADVINCVRKFLCKVHGTSNDHNYGPSLETLFNIPKDTDPQNTVNLLWCMLEELRNVLQFSGIFPLKIHQWMNDTCPTRDRHVQTDPQRDMIDQKFVQVTCEPHEVKRRISAFIKRKRAESDAFNRREFCKALEGSCARTDAVYVPRQSKKSLVKIRRVVNQVYARQNQQVNCEDLKTWQPSHPSGYTYRKLPPAAQERLSNLNAVINPANFISEHQDVYSKIKELEEKVLYLETLSPEYFHPSTKPTLPGVAMSDNRKAEYTSAVSVEEPATMVDMRIAELKKRLKMQADQMKVT